MNIKQVLALNPCDEYTEDRLLELSGGRREISALEMLDLPIPAEDILWLSLRLVPSNRAAAFAEWCSERAAEAARAAAEAAEAAWAKATRAAARAARAAARAARAAEEAEFDEWCSERASAARAAAWAADVAGADEAARKERMNQVNWFRIEFGKES